MERKPARHILQHGSSILQLESPQLRHIIALLPWSKTISVPPHSCPTSPCGVYEQSNVVFLSIQHLRGQYAKRAPPPLICEYFLQARREAAAQGIHIVVIDAFHHLLQPCRIVFPTLFPGRLRHELPQTEGRLSHEGLLKRSGPGPPPRPPQPLLEPRSGPPCK